MAKIGLKKRGLVSYNDPAARHAVMRLCGRGSRRGWAGQRSRPAGSNSGLSPASDAEDEKEKGDFRVPISRFFRSFVSFFLYPYIAEHLYFRNPPICQIYPSRCL